MNCDEKQDTVHTITAHANLGEALRREGAAPAMPCAGRKTCGKCAVFARGDLSAPTAEEAGLLSALNGLKAPEGFALRLACFCELQGRAKIILPESGAIAVAAAAQSAAAYDGTQPERQGLAVDIGTTTVTLLLFALGQASAPIAVNQSNRQASFGADILSRISAANAQGTAPLQRAIVSQLDEMLTQALHLAGKPRSDIARACITGNTTMLHLLTGRDPASIGTYPFVPQSLFGEEIDAGEIFPGLTCGLYLPPAISAYAGADLLCGILATGLAEQEGSLLLDIGTNGEMALSTGGKLFCCATAAGPVFEGACISHGMPAVPGAVDHVWTKQGRTAFSVLGGGTAKGLCGTGLIDLTAALLALGLIDETGLLEAGAYHLSQGISLRQEDVRALQLAKAAIAAGVDTLLQDSGCSSSVRLLLSGGFGSYINAQAAAAIGLIPKALSQTARPAGNTALAGAVALTRSRALRRRAAQLAAEAIEIPLATHAAFMERYIGHMNFEA